MNKNRMNIGVDFADSTFKSFETIDDSILIIKLISWEEKLIKIVFNDFIQFSYKLNYHISNIYQILDITDFFKEALVLSYEKVPDTHPYKLFHLEDLRGFPFIQVVAESVQVVKE